MSPDSAETRIGRLERMVAKLEQRVEDVMAIALVGIREDIQDCASAVKALRVEVEEERRQVVVKERSQARERILDRRWMIGTIIAASGLVIAAMAVLLQGSP